MWMNIHLKVMQHNNIPDMERDRKVPPPSHPGHKLFQTLSPQQEAAVHQDQHFTLQNRVFPDAAAKVNSFYINLSKNGFWLHTHTHTPTIDSEDRRPLEVCQGVSKAFPWPSLLYSHTTRTSRFLSSPINLSFILTNSPQTDRPTAGWEVEGDRRGGGGQERWRGTGEPRFAAFLVLSGRFESTSWNLFPAILPCFQSLFVAFP